ncbi:glycosyltransferase [Edaphobacter albus]|uniref:glycosyltransferase n=1 Tax=Edaphobacter sp. 4G125 TaxID=2763071 RepID=UPI001644093E|nr:glycosyltransferase [Edaphobacter sp. 4G125]QNI35528.1 glycosyltransferase [Edaphobacter sp. 4G125]
MQILHLIGTLSPEAGGPSQAVRTFLSYKDIGYFGEAVTLDNPAEPFLKNIDFPVHAVGSGNSGYGYSYSSKLVPWLRENHSRFDGVVVDGLWNYCGFATWRALAGTDTPYMVFPHGMLDPYFKHISLLKHLKKWLYWAPVEYRVLRDAYRVLFTSTAERDLAEQSFSLHRWTPHIVPYGTSGVPDRNPANLAETFFERCPDVRNHRFLLYLSRIHRKKGCDLLIRAFGKAAHMDAGLHLVMAGPDLQGWGEELRQIARDLGVDHRIHWPGMLAGDAKWGAFYTSEAFILPSHQENFGIAVAEAMSCRKPVLLSDKVNIAEVIANDQAGFMESDTEEGTLRLLERWIATPSEERLAMGERAVQCFRQRYDMRESARMILQLFEASKGPKGKTVLSHS